MTDYIDPRHQASLEGSRRSEPTMPEPDDTGDAADPGPDAQWLSLSRNAYIASDDWFNSSIRRQAERNLANFSNRHPAGSKYHSDTYQKKSHLFVPKTRSMVRRSEAAMAIALFSTQDLVAVTPYNDTDPDQRDAAEVHQALLNFRMEENMRWFVTAVGGAQDAFTTGVVISKQLWRYDQVTEEVAELVEEADGTMTVDISEEQTPVRDEPDVQLVPLENLRIDPGADWRDPIGTSPYVIELVPMYVYEIKEKQNRINPRTGNPEYRDLGTEMLSYATRQDYDSVRRAREGARIDKYDADGYINDYRVVWVHRNIVRVNGQDWIYDTLGTDRMLSEPELLHEVHPWLKRGERPYAMGFAVTEAHKQYPAAPVQLVEDLQELINDVKNLRMDNVRLSLNKRYFVRRGMGVDMTALLRNVPGSAVLMTSTEDVKETQPQDVTAGSFQEADRLALEFDEIGGNFSAASIGTNRNLNETVGGMSMLSADASQIQEYQIRTITETWVQTVVRQLVQMERVLETDEELLQRVAATTSLPLERVIQVLPMKVNVRVNVGFNSTQPERRIGKLVLALDAISKFAPQVVQSQMNTSEVIKEVFGAVGYRDGARFFPQQQGKEDPMVTQLKQQVAQLTQMLEGKQMEVQGRVQVAQIGAQARLQAQQMASQTAVMLAQLKFKSDSLRLKLEQVDRQIAMEGADVKRKELYLQREALSHSIQEADRKFVLAMQQASDKRGSEALKFASTTMGGSKTKKLSGPKVSTEEPDSDPGAENLEGNDKAGVLSRADYGAVPQAEG